MKFELYISKRKKEFHFRLKAKNGRVILTSQGYESKQKCENGINSVRQNGTNSDQFIRKKTPTRKYHFTLQATDLQIIGTSQSYTTAAAMEKGIRSVMANAPEALIIDLTKTEQE